MVSKMSKFNRSPGFWLILGIFWSLTVLVMAIEDNFVFGFSHVIIGLSAVLSYLISIFYTLNIEQRRNIMKKIVSLLMSLVLILSTSFTVFAAENVSGTNDTMFSFCNNDGRNCNNFHFSY